MATSSAPGSLTVAIVTRELDRDFEECIACTQSQTLAPSEVIVVSGSVTQEAASRWPYATFVVSRSNRSEARNIAGKRSSSDLVCFWESDSLFSDNWIEEVVEVFRNGADAVIDRRKCYEPSTYFQRCWDRQFDIRYSHYKPFSAWAFRRDVLTQTGGFDEELDYAEDTDLGSRVLSQGFSIRLAERAVQYHKGEPKSFSDLVRRRFRFGRRKANGYYRKHPSELPRAKMVASLLGPVGLAAFAVAGFPLLAVSLVLASFCLLSGSVYLSSRHLLDPIDAPGIALARILGGITYHWGVFTALLGRRFQRMAGR